MDSPFKYLDSFDLDRYKECKKSSRKKVRRGVTYSFYDLPVPIQKRFIAIAYYLRYRCHVSGSIAIWGSYHSGTYNEQCSDYDILIPKENSHIDKARVHRWFLYVLGLPVDLRIGTPQDYLIIPDKEIGKWKQN